MGAVLSASRRADGYHSSSGPRCVPSQQSDVCAPCNSIAHHVSQQVHTATDFPRPWRSPRPRWMGPWAAWSSLAFKVPEARGLELDDP